MVGLHRIGLSRNYILIICGTTVNDLVVVIKKLICIDAFWI